MLVHALEQAKPGEKILVAQFGQGCDALLFEVTPESRCLPKRNGVTGSLARRKEETNYLKFLALQRPHRAREGHARGGRQAHGAVGAVSQERHADWASSAANAAFAARRNFRAARICVNPNCKAVDSQDPHSFAETQGTVLSWSADFLTYSMDPPNHYGMITFADGGRLMADITDVEQGQIDTGTKVRMVFRIKDFDEQRGFRRYFWKAAPV